MFLWALVGVEGQCARLSRFHNFWGGLPNPRFAATPADRADNGAIISNQHLGRAKRGNRAPDIDDRGDSTAASLAPELHDLFVDVHYTDSNATWRKHWRYGGRDFSPPGMCGWLEGICMRRSQDEDAP